MTNLVDLSQYRKKGSRKPGVFFSRDELRAILDVYSRRVAAGEWKDYAIDRQGADAFFTVFRHSFDAPLFTIGKRRNAKVDEFLLINEGRTVKRSASLEKILMIVDRPARLLKLPSNCS